MTKKFKGKYRIESNRAQFWDYSAPADYFITICIADRKNILGHIDNGIMVLSEYGKIVETEIKKIPEYHKRIILDESVVMPNHIHMIITLGKYGFDNGISTIGDKYENVGNGDGIGDRDGDGDCFNGEPVEKIHEFSLPRPQQQPPSPSKNAPQSNQQNPPSPSKNAPQSNQPQPPSNNHPHQKNQPKKPSPKPTIDQIKQYRKQRRKMLIPKILGKFQQQTSKHINISRNTPGTKNWQANYHDHIIRDGRAYHYIKKYIINNPKKWTEDKFNMQQPNAK